MVCEKCQLKQQKVITPEIIRKPIYKQTDETKEQPKKLITDEDCIDFGAVTTSKLAEVSLENLN